MNPYKQVMKITNESCNRKLATRSRNTRISEPYPVHKCSKFTSLFFLFSLIANIFYGQPLNAFSIGYFDIPVFNSDEALVKGSA